MSILLTGERNVKCNMKPPYFSFGVSLNSLVSFSLGPYNIDSVLNVILLCWNTFTRWTGTTLHIAPPSFFAQLPRIFHYRTWGFFVSTATAAGTWINTAVVYLHCTHTHCLADILERREENIPTSGNHSHVAVVRLLYNSFFLCPHFDKWLFTVGMEPS